MSFRESRIISDTHGKYNVMVRSNFRPLHKLFWTGKVPATPRVVRRAQVHSLFVAYPPAIQGQRQVLVVCRDAPVQQRVPQECELGDLLVLEWAGSAAVKDKSVKSPIRIYEAEKNTH